MNTRFRCQASSTNADWYEALPNQPGVSIPPKPVMHIAYSP